MLAIVGKELRGMIAVEVEAEEGKKVAVEVEE